jgi:hypothetical protein
MKFSLQTSRKCGPRPSVKVRGITFVRGGSRLCPTHPPGKEIPGHCCVFTCKVVTDLFENN